MLLALILLSILPSPDGRLRAVVSDSSLRIEDARSGRTFRIHRPEGWTIVQAEWSPNSRFFVVGLTSSGGHQPWSRPIRVYSRDTNRVRDSGLTVVAPFTLRAPSILETRILDPRSEAGKAIKVNLLQLPRPPGVKPLD